MKSDLIGKEKEEQPATYPCLKISKTSGTVVMFTSKDTGTVIHQPVERNCLQGQSLGDYSDVWRESNFELLRGEITLSN